MLCYISSKVTEAIVNRIDTQQRALTIDGVSNVGFYSEKVYAPYNISRIGQINQSMLLGYILVC